MIDEENRRFDHIRECAEVNGPCLHGEDKCDVRLPWLQIFLMSPIYLYRHGEQ